MKDKKILMAMSGGVDSTAAIILLKNDGWDVIGVTLDMGCNSTGIEMAAISCKQLQIPHIVCDCQKAFEEKVINPFVADYACGRTPSPCVGCNRDIKFTYMLNAADELGASYIATGHYARKYINPETGCEYISVAADKQKDQSYMLCLLSNYQLRHTVFPLGELTKTQIRKIAEDSGLVCASARDSQDVCFDSGDYKSFIQSRGVRFVPGDFVDACGRVLGRHNGLPGYTIGQRKGLGVSAAQPLYVADKNSEKNTITLVYAESFSCSDVYLSSVNWFGEAPPENGTEVAVKLRYTTKTAKAKIIHAENGAMLSLAEPQRIPAPGQIAAIYSSNGEILLGGGVIERSN